MSLDPPPIPPEALASLRNGSPPDLADPFTGDVQYGSAMPQLAQTLLDVVVAYFHARGNDVPARRIVVPGEARQAAWDCDDGQLQVGMIGIGWGAAPGRGDNFGNMEASQLGTVMRHLVLEVCLVRRGVVPDQSMGPAVPSADAVTKAGLQSMRDAGLLSEAIMRAAETMEQGLTTWGCMVRAGTIEPIGPQGKLYGLVHPFTITLGTVDG